MDTKKWGPVTWLVMAITVLYAVTGAAVVLFGEGLSFEEYGNMLWKFVAASGLVGIGRGLAGGGDAEDADAGTRSSTRASARRSGSSGV